MRGLFSLLLAVILPILMCGQTSVTEVFDPFASDTVGTTPDRDALPIPPLSMVLDSAMKYSPILESKNKELAMLDQETALQARKWLDYLYVEGNATYGRFNQFFTTQLTGEDAQGPGTILNSAQGQYYAGVSLKMPISSMLNRNQELNVKQLKREQTQWDTKQLRQDLRERIITEYYRLRFLKESMRTLLSTFETLHVSYLKAQKDVEKGRMKLDEFALIASTVGKAQNEYLKAKNEFYGQYEMLELLAGFNFNN